MSLEKKRKLKYVTVTTIVWLIGTIVCSGQITLTDEQFKFYAEFVIDNEILKQDTFLLREKARKEKVKTDSIQLVLKSETEDLKNAIGKDTTIRNNYKNSYSNCTEQKVKIKKWNKFWKNTTVTLTLVAIIETSIIIYSIKK